ncbi:MAG: efflux RND transporter periplasmic adaptor subunit [Sphingobacteriia bacterium]|nr:MAG: efflux RND transporter periplasmic adaptor subunit [Sphingobacteriia bacterium]
MHTIQKYSLIALSALVLAACGGAEKTGNSLAEKKTALEKLQNDQTALNTQIEALQKEIAGLDTTAAAANAKLVGISVVAQQDFAHYIDLQGNVTNDNISYVSPRMGPGQVKAIYVKKGDQVKKGQLLLKLDDAVMRQSVIAAQKNLETLRNQLSFAKDLYNRQNNLWKDGIGTEVQLISAKNNVTTLERQLSASEEQVKVAEEQLRASNILADVTGVVDNLNVRVGEIFAGLAGIQPQLSIVGNDAYKVVTEVPENYSGRIHTGSKVLVTFPDINKSLSATVTNVSRAINANNRSFEAEVRIAYDAAIRPNQLAQLRFQDYAAAKAIAISVNTVQTDEKGKYVFVAVQEGTKLVARKKAITVGELNGQQIEVRSGLMAGDKLITEGYQNIYEGQLLAAQTK